MNDENPRIDSAEIEERLNSAIYDLEELINLSETKYSFIYEVLPGVESEVGLSIRAGKRQSPSHKFAFYCN